MPKRRRYLNIYNLIAFYIFATFKWFQMEMIGLGTSASLVVINGSHRSAIRVYSRKNDLGIYMLIFGNFQQKRRILSNHSPS